MTLQDAKVSPAYIDEQSQTVHPSELQTVDQSGSQDVSTQKAIDISKPKIRHVPKTSGILDAGRYRPTGIKIAA